MIHAGEATNVVPDSCELQGTVRTFTLEVLDLIEQRMRKIAQHACAAHDAQCDLNLCATTRPPSTPRPKPHLRARSWPIVGEANVLAQEPTMGAEDFSYMLQAPARGLLLHCQRRWRPPRPGPAAAGRARCTTPATTSTMRSSRWRHLLGAPGTRVAEPAQEAA